MKPRRLRAFLVLPAALLCAATGIADTPKPSTGPVVPATPTNFTNTTNRINGTGSGTLGVSGSGGSFGINPQTKPAEKTVRTTTYIALGESRQWKSADGKTLIGKLIAFEDLTVEVKLAPGQQPQPAAPPVMPDKPTVVREGKARLLIDSKPFEVALDRLSEEDRKLVEGIKAAVDAKPAAKAK
jgi:hypothetical protein